LATANPQDIHYNNRTSIAKNEITLLPPLLDRFDQIYVFLNTRTEAEYREYADARIRHTTERKPHNYNFITKYLLYAKTLQPAFTVEAKSMLKEFWISLMTQNMAGNRTLETIFRIAEATAKLRLKTVVEVGIAAEAIESVRLMLVQHEEFVKTAGDPRVVAIDAAIEVVENIQGPIEFEEVTNQVCREKPQVKSWLLGGKSNRLDVENNRRYRELRDRFIQRIDQPESKIILVTKKPLVVVWQTSKTMATVSTTETTDTTDIKTFSLENGDKINQTAENSHDKKIGLNHDTGVQLATKWDANFFDGKDKSVSLRGDMSVMSVAAACASSGTGAASSKVSNNGPEYEYLEPVKAFRCKWCRCIYHADTKDTNAAHHCNLKRQEISC